MADYAHIAIKLPYRDTAQILRRNSGFVIGEKGENSFQGER